MSLASIRTLHGVDIPDTPIVSAAHEYIKAYLDEETYNHVMRSMIYGFVIASKISTEDIRNRDLEAHAVSAMMHDLAWNAEREATKKFVSQDRRFEVDAADAAREFLSCSEAREKWPRERLQLVWDSIALHTTRSIAMYKQAVVCCTALGIAADLLPPGTPIHPDYNEAVVTRDEQQAALNIFPKGNLPEYVKNAMCGLCIIKPSTTYDNVVGRFGELFVPGFTLKGTSMADKIAAQLAKC